MFNIGQMMKQVQDMQAKMADMQSRLGEVEVEGQAGNGLVRVTLTGKGEMKAIAIDPKAVDPSDVEMLEDLVVAAVNDAKAKADAAVAGETDKIMGGLKLPPGMKLPF